jgi:hypothetical protein
MRGMALKAENNNNKNLGGKSIKILFQIPDVYIIIFSLSSSMLFYLDYIESEQKLHSVEHQSP